MIRNSIIGLALLLGSFGCAASTPRPIATDAALGKVVIYRNGVAYFERHARVDGDQLVLDVPAERMDDFLKSLTIVDAKTGKSLPVAFPTPERVGADARMVVQLPAKGRHDLKISYVTESPAWKPSYRLVLGDGGKGKLEAWAVVDNVSGEDWRKVTVGVGSTSALSFRYDLHSVRFVERETLDDGRAIALAPPTGGSPYAVAGKELQVVGNLDLDTIDGIDEEARSESDGNAAKVDASRERRAPGHVRGHGGTGRSAAAATGVSAQAMEPPPSQSIAGLARQIKDEKKKIRIEGFARAADDDKRTSSLGRANAVRDRLIANGVPADQIEAVGTGRVSRNDGVRVLTVNEEAKPLQPTGASPGTEETTGNAFFVADHAMTIEDGHSAMVSMLATPAQAREVYFYDPISTRGSKLYAFRAVELMNPSEYTLDGGPFTVYAEGQFLGEGLSEAVPPKSKAFIPFGLDKKLLVEPESSEREEIEQLVTVERGVVTAEARRIRRTEMNLHNRGDAPAVVYVRHAVPAGWQLHDPTVKFEKLRGAHLFPVTVPPRGAKKLRIEEATPIQKTVDIRTDDGIRDLALYVQASSKLDAGLRARLADIIELHRSMADVGERIATLHEQMGTYRTRLDEIHVQLVTLRKNPHANRLRDHLAKKLEEISERLQKATIEVADLEGQRMAKKIGLQDRLAELTLEKRREKSDKLAAN